MRATVAALVALCLACGSASGAGIRLGEYDGTLADGTTLSLILDQDPANGKYRALGATVTFQEPCTGLGTGTIFSSGWSWDPDRDFVNGQASITMPDNPSSYVKFLANLREGRISGSVEIVNAVLMDDSGKYLPTFCGKNQFQRADLYFTGPARFTPPPKGTAAQRLNPAGGAR